MSKFGMKLDKGRSVHGSDLGEELSESGGCGNCGLQLVVLCLTGGDDMKGDDGGRLEGRFADGPEGGDGLGGVEDQLVVLGREADVVHEDVALAQLPERRSRERLSGATHDGVCAGGVL